MNNQDQFDNQTICKQLFDKFRGILSWKWDDWTATILAEFSVDKEEDVRAILEKFLPISWDSSNINKAPLIVQTVEKHLGGLRPSQFLFSSHPSSDAIVFCAWWPWGNGKTISLRIAPFDRNLTKPEKDKLIEQLKAWAEIEHSSHGFNQPLS